MSAPSFDERIAAAGAYDALFVPAIFRHWAPLVAAAGTVAPGQAVLDVACGTGALSREVLRLVGEQGSVTALDLSDGMIAVARRNFPALDCHLGTAEALPFDDTSFDVVLCQFGLMFFQDRETALREMLRVLKPGGRLALAVWASLSANPVFADEVRLLEQMAGTAAADALRAPFVLGDDAALQRLAVAAGIGSFEVTTVTRAADFDDFRTLVEADLRGWLPMMGVELDEPLIQSILAAATKRLAPHSTHPGRAVFPVTAHVLSAARLD